MKEILSEIINWIWPVITIFLIILVATRKALKGKKWLMAHLAISLTLTLFWKTVSVLLKTDVLDYNVYDWFGIPLRIVGMASYCLLIPYILKAGEEEAPNTEKQTDDSSGNQEAMAIGGWLVFPAIGLILGPIITIVSLVIALGMFEDVADAGYGGVYALNIIVEIGLLAFIIYAATRFFGKKSNTPSTMITLMIVSVVATALCLVIDISAEAEMMAIENGKALLKGIVSAAIWIPYFRVSDRVKKTFVN